MIVWGFSDGCSKAIRKVLKVSRLNTLYPGNITALSFGLPMGVGPFESHLLKWPVTKHVSQRKRVCCFRN